MLEEQGWLAKIERANAHFNQRSLRNHCCRCQIIRENITSFLNIQAITLSDEFLSATRTELIVLQLHQPTHYAILVEGMGTVGIG